MRLGIAIVAIARDRTVQMRKFNLENGFKFTVIADVKGNLIKDYNVYTFGNAGDLVHFKTRMAIPTSFFLNKEGKVLWVHLGSRLNRPSNAILLNMARKLYL